MYPVTYHAQLIQHNFTAFVTNNCNNTEQQQQQQRQR